MDTFIKIYLLHRGDFVGAVFEPHREAAIVQYSQENTSVGVSF